MDQTERAKRANVRITAYTFAAVLVFVCGHVGLISTIPLITHCLSMQNPEWTQQAVSLGSMTFLAYLYVRAWIEFVRLIYVRWVRRTEFIARVGLPPIPEPASNSAISREHLWLFILAAVFSAIIIRCAGLDPSVIPDRGLIMSLIGGMLGLVGTVFWCWVVRVQEPYLAFD